MNGSCLIDWSWFVSRFMNWSSTGISFIYNFHDISRIFIMGVVFNNLSTTIRKSNSVLSVGWISVSSFVLSKINTRIFILYSIFILVLWWCEVIRLMIRCLLNRFVRWRRFVNWSRFVCWSSMIYWGRFMYWSRMIYWSRLMNWSRMIYWGWFVYGSMIRRYWVNWSCCMNWCGTMFNCGMAGNLSITSGKDGN